MKLLIFFASLALAQTVEVQSLSCKTPQAVNPSFTCTATFTGAVPAATTLTATIGSNTDNPTRTMQVPVPSGATSVTFQTGNEQCLKARLPGQP